MDLKMGSFKSNGSTRKPEPFEYKTEIEMVETDRSCDKIDCTFNIYEEKRCFNEQAHKECDRREVK